MWSAYIYLEIDIMGFSKNTDTTFNQTVLVKHLFSSLQNNNNKNDHMVRHSSSFHTQNYPSSSHTCQPIQFTGIKLKKSLFSGDMAIIIRKWIQENIIFMRFCCCFKLSKKTEKLSNEQLTHPITKCTLTGIVQ